MTWTEQKPAGSANYNWRTGVCSSTGGILQAAALRLYVYGVPWEVLGNIPAYPSPAADFIFFRNAPPWIEQQPAGPVDASWQTGTIDSAGDTEMAGILAGRLYVDASPPDILVCVGDISACPAPQSLCSFGSSYIFTGSMSAYPSPAACVAQEPHAPFTNLWIYMLARAARRMKKRRIRWPV